MRGRGASKLEKVGDGISLEEGTQRSLYPECVGRFGDRREGTGGTGQILVFEAMERYVEFISLGATEPLESSGGRQVVIVKASLTSTRRQTDSSSLLSACRDAVVQEV